MLGFRYLKAPPTRFVSLYKNGHPVRQGNGASFWFFAPSSTILSIELASVDVPFVFEEVSSDFQEVSIQGQLGYRIEDPEKLITLMNYEVDKQGRYVSDDPDKLNDRLIHLVQQRAKRFCQNETLENVLLKTDELSADLLNSLQGSEFVSLHGVEVLSLVVLAIKPTPEMAKAMQADAREKFLMKADQAMYGRRNTAIELERELKENELNTERTVEEKRLEVRRAAMQADVEIESQREQLVEQQVANNRKLADAQNDSLRGMLDAMKSVDWKTIAAASGNGEARGLIAMAFQQIAENAQKIGRLDISPDLLSRLLDDKDENFDDA